jgi:hypothetical protein
LERLADWLAELVEVELVNNLAVAEALTRRRGMPAALLANPQAQGSADVFCAGLLDMLQPQHIVLMSDAMNAGFASRHGMGWLSASASLRQEVIRLIDAILKNQNEGSVHGSV